MNPAYIGTIFSVAAFVLTFLLTDARTRGQFSTKIENIEERHKQYEIRLDEERKGREEQGKLLIKLVTLAEVQDRRVAMVEKSSEKLNECLAQMMIAASETAGRERERDTRENSRDTRDRDRDSREMERDRENARKKGR